MAKPVCVFPRGDPIITWMQRKYAYIFILPNNRVFVAAVFLMCVHWDSLQDKNEIELA